MKTIFLSLLFLVVVGQNTAKSQNYTPVSETSEAFWIDNFTCGDLPPTPGMQPISMANYTISFFDGDTLMSGMTYKKVYRKEISINQGWYWGPTPVVSIGISASHKGFFRQDIPGKKGYFRRTHDTLDRLLFDFSKSPGDTLRYFTYYPMGQGLMEVVKVVGSIDSILFKGSYRRRVQYQYVQTSPPVQFWQGNFYEAIEGIGDFTGLDFNHYQQNMRIQTCVYYFLTGYCEDGYQLVFNNIFMNSPVSCSMLTKATGIQTEPIKQKALIYPNPVGRGQSIKLGIPAEPMTIRTYLPDGRLVEETALEEEWKAPDRPGLYLIRLFDQKGKLVLAQKLQVE